jgi:Mlc titration factor MtfA (ptsG expression regulator)
MPVVNLSDKKIFPIERSAAMFRQPWDDLRIELPDTIKWCIAQAVAQIEFKLQELLQEKNMQRVSDFQVHLLVTGEVNAISREAGLPEGATIKQEIHSLVVDYDIGSGRMTVL